MPLVPMAAANGPYQCCRWELLMVSMAAPMAVLSSLTGYMTLLVIFDKELGCF